MRSISSLPSSPGPLCPGIVKYDKVQSMGQIELNCVLMQNWNVWNRTVFPGDNTPQDTNYTATCLPSRKLYKLDEPDTRDTAREARTNPSVMYPYGPPHMAKQKQDDQLEHTYSSYVRIRDVTLKTCQKRWMIGRSCERGSGISVLAARHDDDDEITDV